MKLCIMARKSPRKVQKRLPKEKQKRMRKLLKRRNMMKWNWKRFESFKSVLFSYRNACSAGWAYRMAIGVLKCCFISSLFECLFHLPSSY